MNAVGYTKKHKDGKWDVTLLWRNGAYERWHFKTQGEAKKHGAIMCQLLWLELIGKWRKG